MTTVSLTVNGQSVTADVDPRTLLVHFLRENLRLTGTHVGCDTSQCGSCVIHLNGQAVKSCTTLAVQAHASVVTTIEGIAQGGELHPMQAAFIKHDGYQCGYCTPGQICSAVAVLDEIKRGVPSHAQGDLMTKPTATNVEMRERMSGNICRCGAYSNIAEAMAEVAGAKA